MVMRGTSVAAGIDTTDHLVVYLDVSKSMKGFISERRGSPALPAQTVFSKTLLALRSVVETISPQPKMVLRVVNTKVQPPVNDLKLTLYAINRRWFRSGMVSLPAAFDAFLEPLEEKRPGAEARPARFHILLTDGVQSNHGDCHDLNGLRVSDMHCVREKISRLLNTGWSGTVLGVRGEFDGLVFSAVRRNWAVRHGSGRDNPETLRPFYLYIFSPDQGALSKLVEAVKNKLRPMLKSSDQLREYALAASYVTAAASGDLVSMNEETYTLRREESAPAETLYFNVSIATPTVRRTPHLPQGDALLQSDAPIIFTLRIPWSHHGQDSGTPQEVSGMVKWELIQMASTSDQDALYPEMKIIGSTVNTDGSVILQIAASWKEGVGKRRALIYRLVGRLDLEKTAPPWVAEWSTATDTTPEEAWRTLNLKGLLAHLWNNQSLQRQEVATACLRVGD